MDLREIYQSKVISASAAADLVKSGDWVDYGVGASHPVAFGQALAARAGDLQDVQDRGSFTLWMSAIVHIESPGEHFGWNSWHYAAVDRRIMEMGCGFHSPMSFFEPPRYYSENVKPISGEVCQVAPMGGDGCFSFGGKSIVCLASTYGSSQQRRSRVVSTLSEGTIVSGSRTLTQWVVTEYGKANLKGMSTWQRDEALIAMAHSDYRDDLIRDASRMGIWRRSNK